MAVSVTEFHHAAAGVIQHLQSAKALVDHGDVMLVVRDYGSFHSYHSPIVEK